MIFSEILYGTLDPMRCIHPCPSCLDNRRCQVGAVCRYWRQCLLEHPALWRVIDIQLYKYDPSKAPQILDRITRCVQRSGACLLDIRITLDSSYHTESRRDHFYSIVDAITGHDGDGNVLRRWTRFILDGRHLSYAPLSLLGHLSLRLASHAPALRELDFWGCHMQLPGTSQHLKLTTLRLSDCKITFETTVQRLPELRLRGYEFSTVTPNGSASTISIYSPWLRLLSSILRLTHLYLLKISLAPVNLSSEPIILANLIHLEMTSSPPSYFLPCVHCPKLRHLTFDAPILAPGLLKIAYLMRRAPQFARIPIIGFKSWPINDDCFVLKYLSELMDSSSGLQEMWVGLGRLWERKRMQKIWSQRSYTW